MHSTKLQRVQTRARDGFGDDQRRGLRWVAQLLPVHLRKRSRSCHLCSAAHVWHPRTEAELPSTDGYTR